MKFATLTLGMLLQYLGKLKIQISAADVEENANTLHF